MTDNNLLLYSFYKAFQDKDAAAMGDCYADQAVFSDEVFVDLNAYHVRAMWEMLIKRGSDLSIEFKNIKADEYKGSAEWIATYTFSASNRKVINHVFADFTFENGKIIKHTDHFDFYKWAKQALGLKGLLLGKTSFLKNKVRSFAKKGLEAYISKRDQKK